MARILVIGLNPAWQTILSFDELKLGEVNRSKTSSQFASGKGFNVAKVLKNFGHEIFLLQVLGGELGQCIEKECEELGIYSLSVWVKEETRRCTTLLSKNGVATELISPFKIDPSEARGVDEKILQEVLPKEMLKKHFDLILFCGSIPKGLDENIFSRIVKLLPTIPYMVDAWKNLDQEFIEKALCFKINLAEYSALKMTFRNHLPNADFAITDGGEQAKMIHQNKLIHVYTLPQIERLMNPIGAGDTVMAGLAHYYLQSRNLSDAFKKGLGMGMASCLEWMPSEFDQENAKEFESNILVTEIT